MRKLSSEPLNSSPCARGGARRAATQQGFGAARFFSAGGGAAGRAPCAAPLRWRRWLWCPPAGGARWRRRRGTAGSGCGGHNRITKGATRKGRVSARRPGRPPRGARSAPRLWHAPVLAQDLHHVVAGAVFHQAIHCGDTTARQPRPAPWPQHARITPPPGPLQRQRRVRRARRPHGAVARVPAEKQKARVSGVPDARRGARTVYNGLVRLQRVYQHLRGAAAGCQHARRGAAGPGGPWRSCFCKQSFAPAPRRAPTPAAPGARASPRRRRSSGWAAPRAWETARATRRRWQWPASRRPAAAAARGARPEGRLRHRTGRPSTRSAFRRRRRALGEARPRLGRFRVAAQLPCIEEHSSRWRYYGLSHQPANAGCAVVSRSEGSFGRDVQQQGACAERLLNLLTRAQRWCCRCSTDRGPGAAACETTTTATRTAAQEQARIHPGRGPAPPRWASGASRCIDPRGRYFLPFVRQRDGDGSWRAFPASSAPPRPVQGLSAPQHARQQPRLGDFRPGAAGQRRGVRSGRLFHAAAAAAREAAGARGARRRHARRAGRAGGGALPLRSGARPRALPPRPAANCTRVSCRRRLGATPQQLTRRRAASQTVCDALEADEPIIYGACVRVAPLLPPKAPGERLVRGRAAGPLRRVLRRVLRRQPPWAPMRLLWRAFSGRTAR